MKTVITVSMILYTFFAFSQEQEKKADKYLPKGNEAFAEKEYAQAEANYRISKSNEPTQAVSAYNLGNAIYRQDKPGEAKFAYLKAIENAKDKKDKHRAFHNLGNVFMLEKNYQGAVDAYKNALRNNPYDDETRYNYALAKKMLKENPPPKDDKKDDKKDQKKDDKSQQPKDNKDKNKGDKGDQKDKGDKGEEKDKDKNGQGDQKDNKNGKDKQDKGAGGKEEQQQGGESPEKQRMQNLLDAMNNEEKKIQDKINAQKVKVQPKRQEKDW
ncbi:tetratricopeptide repeat protein [Flavobacterium sp. MK4S-17]|uniref:tetratricopeptide repeat protein n=1 Tax=Flavobacterium sp. MK4S-17 TaxID=2543737 RepID=UPI001357ED46|nr:tetratricopeptide repeat protein [Flavobacterium sp. MK4S-17]